MVTVAMGSRMSTLANFCGVSVLSKTRKFLQLSCP